MHYYLEPKLQRSFRNKSIRSTPMDPKSLRVFWSISETFGMKKMQSTQNDDWDIFGAFRKPSESRCETCVSGLNALFRGIDVAMHS
jgi:hypothetical protein